MRFSITARTLVFLIGLGLLSGSVMGATAQHIERGDSEADTGRGGSFEKVVLEDELTNPMELDVAPDGRVFFVERDGAVRVWSPETDSTTMVGYVPTFAIHNEGMMGLALDPDFEKNGWLYVYHTPIGNATKNELVRFTVKEGRFSLESREVLLTVPTQRDMCCHSGGSIAFGPEGNLYVATGDNTNPEDVDLYASFDERPGREYWDAQRTSANTNDLRGKILRIRPMADGTYTIPDGNLFTNSGQKRPEIYVMGNRNPYRISIDQQTGCLYWGDVGHGASVANEERGPAGHDEINRACEAGNYGWPYFAADNQPFRNYDFATGESGAYFDAERPINDSPNNTGARVLPPAQPALIWYPHTQSDKFPELGMGGQTAMAGPVYHYDTETVGLRGLPASYDGSFFIYDFMRNWIKEVDFGRDGSIREIKPFLPEMEFARPMDLEIGPDGAVYLLEWGTNYGGYNEDAQIVRLEYHSPERFPPAASIVAEPVSGSTPLRVDFEAEDNSNSELLNYAWDFDEDGKTDAHGSTATFTYEHPGRYTAHLTVTDTAGEQNTGASVSISAGNSAPRVSIEEPANGGFIDMNQEIHYQVVVEDAEDASISEDRVLLQPYLGHDTHLHAQQPDTGRVGALQVHPDSSHAPYIEDRFVMLEARYTDEGGSGGAEPLTSRAHVILHPKQKEAEHTTSIQGAERQITGDIRRRTNVQTFIVAEDGDYVSYAPVNLTNINSLTLRVASETGGTVELHIDAPDGTLLGTVEVKPDTDIDNWRDVTVPVTGPDGTYELYLVFRGEEKGTLLKLDWLEFNGPGVLSER